MTIWDLYAEAAQRRQEREAARRVVEDAIIANPCPKCGAPAEKPCLVDTTPATYEENSRDPYVREKMDFGQFHYAFHAARKR